LPAGTALTEWDYKAMYVIGNDNDKVDLMSSIASVVVKLSMISTIWVKQ